jgi:hypothetical protein
MAEHEYGWNHVREEGAEKVDQAIALGRQESII